MVTQTVAPINSDTLDQYIDQAAKAAGYEDGFGVSGCDLKDNHWWAAYCRQSLDQQTQNNRLPEYLFTLAKMAKESNVIIPREYVLYDHETGEHLERPKMIYLRKELAHKRRITGILFADLRGLSREPAPQQVFERECEILGIRLIFGDAPSGLDLGSQFVRSALTFGNKLTRLATNRNARAGNVGRVLKGWVPAHRAPYGYRYCRDARNDSGRLVITKAWWEIDSLGEEGNVIKGSPADNVRKIFKWIGTEGKTLHWVINYLNGTGVPAPSGGKWSPSKLHNLVRNHSYTGKHSYNAFSKQPNPERPLGDITEAIKRTILRPKPKEEIVECSVPQIIPDKVWQKANSRLKKRGRGRGKQGRVIKALLRNRIYCPRCGRPMSVRRKSGSENLYYYCSRYPNWKVSPCAYKTFLPGTWDDQVWDCVYAMLKQDVWVDQQVDAHTKQIENTGKLVKMQENKIQRILGRISRVQEGYEGGIYTLDEAKGKITEYQGIISSIESEISSTKANSGTKGNHIDNEVVRKRLKELADKVLGSATFEEKLNIVNKLDIQVYPSEELTTVRIKCGLPITWEDDQDIVDQGKCKIIKFGPLYRTRTLLKHDRST